MTPPTEADARFASEQLATGCDGMERLLKGLLDSKGRVAEEVHAIRKLGKSLRGGFTLFRLGDTSAKEIQVIGRLLSGPRDAVSRLSTWKKLGWEGDASTTAAIDQLLEQQTHSAARRPPAGTISWCVERVAQARGHLLELPASTLAARMEVGMGKLSKQIVKRCRKLDRCGEHRFHDARKALKAYLGALGFLPEGAINRDPVMFELTEVLGDENDLATLSRWLEEHGFTEDFVPALWARIVETRKLHQNRVKLESAMLVISGKS